MRLCKIVSLIVVFRRRCHYAAAHCEPLQGARNVWKSGWGGGATISPRSLEWEDFSHIPAKIWEGGGRGFLRITTQFRRLCETDRIYVLEWYLHFVRKCPSTYQLVASWWRTSLSLTFKHRNLGDFFFFWKTWYVSKFCWELRHRMHRFTDSIVWTTDKRTDVWSRPSCIYTQIFSPEKMIFSP